MTPPATTFDEYKAIDDVIRRYIEGARSGSAGEMRLAFHKDATIFGYAGETLLAGPIQALYDIVEKRGPLPNVAAVVAGIDIAGAVATVRLEGDKWGERRFTDMFALIKSDGKWQIVNKIFQFHD